MLYSKTRLDPDVTANVLQDRQLCFQCGLDRWKSAIVQRWADLLFGESTTSLIASSLNASPGKHQAQTCSVEAKA